MKQRKLRVFIILIAILPIFFLLNGCSKPDPPKLTLSENSWHYGEVTPDQRPTHDFTLKNEGEEILVIESVYPSCPCVIVELTKKEIPAGKEALLETTFDPTGYEGSIAKYITIKSNDPENPVKKIETTITILHVPNPDIELSEQTFNLGTISREDTPVIKFNISNTGDAELIIEKIVTEELFNHNMETPLTIAPGEQFEAEVYLDSQQLKEGEFRKAIRIMTNDPQNSLIFLRFLGNIK